MAVRSGVCVFIMLCTPFISVCLHLSWGRHAVTWELLSIEGPSPLLGDRHREFVASVHVRDPREVLDSHRHVAVGSGPGGAVAELAQAVVSPGPERAVPEAREAVGAAVLDAPDIREVASPPLACSSRLQDRRCRCRAG